MANPLFLGTDMEDAVFTSSVGDNASYPASNLLTYRKDKEWRSANSNASQYIYLDTGADNIINRTGICVENHNLNGIMSSGTIQIQSATNSAFSSGLTTLESDFQPTTDPYFLSFGGVVTQRYWRILFGGNLSAVPRIGNLFIDKVFDIGFPYDIPHKAGNRKYETSEKTALDGSIRTSQAFAGRKFWEIDFSLLPDTTITSFQTLYQKTRGKLRPFYFIDVASAIHYVHFDTDSDPAEIFRYNLNNLKKIRLKTQLVA